MKLPARYTEKPINFILDLGLALFLAFFAARGIATLTGNDDFISIAILFGFLAFFIACLPLAIAVIVLLAERVRAVRDSRSRSKQDP